MKKKIKKRIVVQKTKLGTVLFLLAIFLVPLLLAIGARLGETTTAAKPSVAPDPIVDCEFSSIGTMQLRRNVCIRSVECPIRGVWVYYDSIDKCNADQQAQIRIDNNRQQKTQIYAPCGSYINTSGNSVPRPCIYNSPPAGATAKCVDGTYSFSQSRRGTCSGHRGVAQWL